MTQQDVIFYVFDGHVQCFSIFSVLADGPLIPRISMSFTEHGGEIKIDEIVLKDSIRPFFFRIIYLPSIVVEW